MEAGKIELEYLPMDLTNFIDDIVSSNYLKIKNKGLDLRVNVDDETPKYVFGDYLRLRQIMMNLVSNSIKFTEKGYIEVGIEHLETIEDSSKLVFFCIDTGIGIPEDKQPSIFESFIQADGSTTRKYGGTGLGTSISKLLVEIMGGQIGLESQLGEGSTFWFVLDMKHSPPPLETEKDMQVSDELQYVLAEERKIESSRILVVEDYEPNQEVARTHLESVGHSVDLASNGAIGVEFALSEKYDLILMDIQMPIMDGLTAAKTIREQDGPNKDSIIVALTANADDETLKMCSENGMNDLITKPIRRKEFLRVVDKWLFLSDSKKQKVEIEPDFESELVEDEVIEEFDDSPFAATEMKDNAKDNDFENLPIVIDVVLDEFGDRDIVDKVISQFIENVSKQVDILRDAINNEDYESCRREAHSVKGGAATLEAVPLSMAAKDIEFACKNEEYDKLPMLYEVFCDEYERLKDFVKTL
jgi:CheY-like chemotaxis protein/HPt (histidine-containing phosphotransfer) domain-containing protein